MTRTACTVLHGFCMWNSLHDTNSLHVFLHDTNSLHGFARFSHDMWLNPVPLPCFFPVRPYVGSSWSWRTPRQGGAERAPINVPSRHSAELALVTKCAERARAEQAPQCRAGTCRKVGTPVPSWHRGGGAVPSGHVPSWHLTKRAEQAQCRAGTCRGTVAPRRSFEAGVEATVVEWLAQRLSTGSPNGLVLARPTSFDGSPNTGSPN